MGIYMVSLVSRPILLPAWVDTRVSFALGILLRSLTESVDLVVSPGATWWRAQVWEVGGPTQVIGEWGAQRANPSPAQWSVCASLLHSPHHSITPHLNIVL